MTSIQEDIGCILSRLLQGKDESGEALVIGEEKFFITREPCPAVLMAANKQNPEILLVQKFSDTQPKKRSHVSSQSSSTPVTIKKSHTTFSCVTEPNEDLDVTGSPLKCPFMQDVGDSNASPFTIPLELCNSNNSNSSLPYLPIPSNKAVLITSKLSLELCKLKKTNMEEFVPIWVACDGKDQQQGILFTGIHIEKDTHHRTLVTTGGPYGDVDRLPSLDHIMRHHTSIGPAKKVESAVKATYSIMASENEVRGSSLNLTCSWKRTFTVLSPPSPDASTIANVHVVRGDPRCPTHKMHLELDVLRGFVKGPETGEVPWLVRKDSKTIAEELEEVFTNIREKGARVKQEDEGACDFDMMIQGKFFNCRLNMDITDQLWNVLMKCESYQELKESLSLVFRAVAGEEVKPQIHACNKTQVGCLLRNLMRGRGSVPDLTGFTPLHMLIELGCEKIKRDYINIFQAEDLVMGEQLAWFIGPEVSASKDMPFIVNQLERLHVALQVVVALRAYLNLPWASLTHFTAQVLNQMKEEQPSTAHTFALKLDTLSVHRLFDSMKVDTWEVSFTSQEGTYAKQLVCCISQTPLIHFSSSSSDFEEEQGDEEDQYFCTFFSSVSDNLMLI